MHRIQTHILARLAGKGYYRRYSELKPKDVEGNVFMYHLRRLIELGYVRKKDDGYELAPKGLQFIDTLSMKTWQPRIQPKIVTLIVCQNSKGEWLLYRRMKSPFYGMVGFPYGKVHLGERLEEAVLRECEEKIKIAVSQAAHIGDAYVVVYEEGEVISHMLAHVFRAELPKGSGEKVGGDCFWAKVDDPADPEYIPGFTEIFRIVAERQAAEPRFFCELEYPDFIYTPPRQEATDLLV